MKPGARQKSKRRKIQRWPPSQWGTAQRNNEEETDKKRRGNCYRARGAELRPMIPLDRSRWVAILVTGEVGQKSEHDSRSSCRLSSHPHYYSLPASAYSSRLVRSMDCPSFLMRNQPFVCCSSSRHRGIDGPLNGPVSPTVELSVTTQLGNGAGEWTNQSNQPTTSSSSHFAAKWSIRLFPSTHPPPPPRFGHVEGTPFRSPDPHDNDNIGGKHTAPTRPLKWTPVQSICARTILQQEGEIDGNRFCGALNAAFHLFSTTNFIHAKRCPRWRTQVLKALTFHRTSSSSVAARIEQSCSKSRRIF